MEIPLVTRKQLVLTYTHIIKLVSVCFSFFRLRRVTKRILYYVVLINGFSR